MKRIAALFLLLFACSSILGQDDDKVIHFADPFILYDDGLYYLYGTGSDSGIPVVVAKDMKTWNWPEGDRMHLALHKDDSYGDYFFWAPEADTPGKGLDNHLFIDRNGDAYI